MVNAITESPMRFTLPNAQSLDLVSVLVLCLWCILSLLQYL